MNSDIKPEVLYFIKQFAGAKDTFQYGCCYWFAEILAKRFSGEIWYNDIDNHFLTRIGGSFYDITGEVVPPEESELFSKWDDFILKEPLGASRIYRDCVLMKRVTT